MDRVEAHLGIGGGPVRIEVGPCTDPSLAEELGRAGVRLRHLDVGGGLGVTYKDEAPPSPAEYGAAIKAALAGYETGKVDFILPTERIADKLKELFG